MELKHVTPSGVTIPDNEMKEIEKAVRKDTLKTVFAIIGVGAAFVFVRGLLASREDSSSND